MKNSKFLSTATLIAILFLSFSSIYASSVTWLEIKHRQNEKSFALFLKTEGKGVIDIEIIDENKHVIFSEKVKSVNAFAKKFNLKRLESAMYVLRVEDENSITTQPVKIEGDKLEIDPSGRRIIYKPVLKFNKLTQHLDITWKIDAKDDILLIIDEDNSNFRFEDSIKNRKEIHKRYDLSKLGRGTYSLKLSSSEQSYFKTIEVK